MSEKLISAPAVEPVTLTEAKAQGIIETSAYDDLVTSKIAAARQWVENYLGRALVAQTWRTRLDCFPGRIIRLNHSPLQSVTSINYLDTNGDSQLLSTDYYDVDTDSEPGRIALAYGYEWPDTQPSIQAVTIESVHGYDGTGDSPLDLTGIPQAIKDAILILVMELYENRNLTVLGLDKTVLDAAESLLFPYRVQTYVY